MSFGSGRCGWCSSTGDEYASQWKAIESIAEKLDVDRETLRVWVRRAEVDAGRWPGLTTDERARIKELERENRELRRANEILKAASAFFGAELDRQSKRWSRSSTLTVNGSGSSRSAGCSLSTAARSPRTPTGWRRDDCRRRGPSATSICAARSPVCTPRTCRCTAPTWCGPNSTVRALQWRAAPSSGSCATWACPGPVEAEHSRSRPVPTTVSTDPTISSTASSMRPRRTGCGSPI